MPPSANKMTYLSQLALLLEGRVPRPAEEDDAVIIEVACAQSEAVVASRAGKALVGTDPDPAYMEAARRVLASRTEVWNCRVCERSVMGWSDRHVTAPGWHILRGVAGPNGTPGVLCPTCTADVERLIRLLRAGNHAEASVMQDRMTRELVESHGERAEPPPPCTFTVLLEAIGPAMPVREKA